MHDSHTLTRLGSVLSQDLYSVVTLWYKVSLLKPNVLAESLGVGFIIRFIRLFSPTSTKYRSSNLVHYSVN